MLIQASQIVWALVVALAPPDASRTDRLIADLGGSDEPARSLARQLLPRAGVEVVPRVMALLSRDKPAVAQAAFQVLSDMANDAAAPGHDADRKVVTEHLLTLVAPNQPEAVRLLALRLVPIVASDDANLEPVASLLDDVRLREKARVALEEAGTTSARNALRARLGKSDPAFTVALLNALGQLSDRPSREAVRALAKHDYPGVRAAAARALAQLGDPPDLETVQGVVQRSDPATRAEAVDALLRLADRLGRLPETRAPAVAVYKSLLTSSRDPERSAALAGLGRFGDSGSVGLIIEAIREASPATAGVGVAALGSIPGDDTTSALLAALPGLAPARQVALIPALGARRHPSAIATLDTFARSSDPAIRRAASRALAASGRPEALPTLLALASTPDDRAETVNRLLVLAGSLEAQKAPDPAGRAYAAALVATRRGEIGPRLRAVEGIARCPVPDAAAALRDAASDPALREPILNAVLAVAGRLHAAARDPEAVELYRVARALGPTGDALRLLAEGLTAAGAGDDVRGLLGTITRWWVIGPFDLGARNEGWTTAFVEEPKVSVVARYMAGKRRVGWTPVVSKDPRGTINLLATVGQRDQCIGYAYAEVVVDRPTDALLLLGVDDGEIVWVNGKKVFELFQARGLQPDQDKIPVQLRAGKNTILLKVYQNTLGWEFCARLVGGDGHALNFSQPSE